MSLEESEGYTSADEGVASFISYVKYWFLLVKRKSLSFACGISNPQVSHLSCQSSLLAYYLILTLFSWTEVTWQIFAISLPQEHIYLCPLTNHRRIFLFSIILCLKGALNNSSKEVTINCNLNNSLVKNLKFVGRYYKLKTLFDPLVSLYLLEEMTSSLKYVLMLTPQIYNP